MQKPLDDNMTMNLCSVERKGLFFIGGEEATLQGNPVKVGDEAPEIIGSNNKMEDVKLSDFHNKVVLLSVFPSIDTPVCATQTREFNKRAVELSEDVEVISISKDLPFALSRFCAAEGIERVTTLSDFKFSRFGLEYGYLVKENQLLARGVIIIDREGVVRYNEMTKDILDEPNYDKALEAIKELL